MMLGDKVAAAEAAQMGMIYKYFPDDTFETEGKKIAETLAKLPTKALGYTKVALNQSMHNDLTQQLQIEEDYQTLSGKTEDFNEGIAAFLEKRPAVFKGK